jgi:homogentisate 1,2-dioxygenase
MRARARWRRSSATCPYREGDYIVIPRGTTYRFANGRPERHLVFESPGLIEIPRRYRNEYGQLLEHAPFYHRDIHPPTELRTHRDRGEHVVKVRVATGYQTYVLDYHPFDVVGWDGYVYPWTFNIDDFEPITGRIHMPPPSHQTVPGPELRDLLVLPAQARLRPAGDPDPVRPLERELGGDDLLRLGQLLVAEGVDVGSVTLHPSGIPHGPHPGSRRSRSG